MKTQFSKLTFLSLFFFFASLQGETYYVDGSNGSDANSCATAQSPGSTAKLTINAGIGCLSAGDELIIATGTYAEGINTPITDIPNGVSWAAATTIRANGTVGSYDVVTIKPGSGVTMNIANNDDYIIFEGLILDCNQADCNAIRIKNSDHIRCLNCELKGAKGSGSGWSVRGDSNFNELVGTNPPVAGSSDCRIHDNGADKFGHGMYISGDDNLVENCEIWDNGGFGVHIYMSGGGPERNRAISNLVHDNNTAPGTQAGILLGSGDDNQAWNNFVYNNETGILFANTACASSDAFNNTVTENSGFGIEIQSPCTDIVLINNIIYNNLREIEDQGTNTTIQSNLTADPSFVNAASDNFDILEGSAAKDQGQDLSDIFTDDFNDNSRLKETSFDVGAYEFMDDGPSVPPAPTNLRIASK